MACKTILEPFLSTPVVITKADGTLGFDYDRRPESIGRVRMYYGNFTEISISRAQRSWNCQLAMFVPHIGSGHSIATSVAGRKWSTDCGRKCGWFERPGIAVERFTGRHSRRQSGEVFTLQSYMEGDNWDNGVYFEG